MNELEILLSLPATENYSPSDRYRDFRKVFMATPEGKRVLREILAWGHMFRSSVTGSPIDPYRTHVADGERNIALRVLSTVTTEPKAQPTRANSKRDET